MMMSASRHSASIVGNLREAFALASKGSCLNVSTVRATLTCRLFYKRQKGVLSYCCTSRLATGSYSTYGSTFKYQDVSRFQNLNDRKIVPDSDPPSDNDVNLLYKFIDRSRKLMVLTGAGLSTESGIPDYRSPHGAYSTGFKPITHQEFVRSVRSRRRYWARSFAGWIRFISANPNAAHYALSSLEKVGRIHYMVTQNVDRLHHRAGSDPLELHGTVYSVVCLECNNSVDRNSFQDRLKDLNPEWAAAIAGLASGNPGSDKNFGMQQRPDADIEIDAKFWEDLEIPNCQQCGGMLKPDVVFFGDNVPKERAEEVKEAARECDSFLIIGSSVMTMSAFRIVSRGAKLLPLGKYRGIVRPLLTMRLRNFSRTAHEAGAPVAVVNIGDTRADEFVSLKIQARCGEILPRVLQMGSLSLPSAH